MTSEKPKIRGLLNQKQSLDRFELNLIEPPEELLDLVSHFWHVRWKLPKGDMYHQTNLPFPHQHLVIDPQRGSGLFGCTTAAFEYEITGTGSVLGARFLPGCAKTIFSWPMSELTDTMVPLADLFDSELSFLEDLLKDDLDGLIKTLTELILHNASSKTDLLHQVGEMIAFVEMHEDIINVNSLADEFDLSTRQLQRLFKDYVGVSPKWVIERYRIFNVLDALNDGKAIDLADLAARLGYTDQAHFSHAFKKLTGQSPKQYANFQI